MRWWANGLLTFEVPLNDPEGPEDPGTEHEPDPEVIATTLVRDMLPLMRLTVFKGSAAWTIKHKFGGVVFLNQADAPALGASDQYLFVAAGSRDQSLQVMDHVKRLIQWDPAQFPVSMECITFPTTVVNNVLREFVARRCAFPAVRIL